MNNSDFLSDAVALDLGKSGVKVAETLEIEVGEEWWRLINAAAVTGGTVYQRRAAAEPVVSGGEIHLDGLTEYRGPTFPPYIGSTGDWGLIRSACAVGKDPSNGLFYGVIGQYDARYSYKMGSRPIFRVFNASGEQVGDDVNLTDEYFYPEYWIFWDAVNSRFIVTCRNVSYTLVVAYVGLPNGSFSYVGYTYNSARPWQYLTEIKTFLEPEVSNYVYSLMRNGTTFYFKKTEITLGVNAKTLVATAFPLTDSTALSAVQNHGNSAFLFYSRAYESVGVMWRDSGSGMRFVLESEAFGTVHELPDYGGGAKQIFSFGNFVVPQEGEFLVAGISDVPSGVLTRQEGFSYPENLAIIGTGEIAENRGVLIGNVGTTIYHIEIDLATKAITDVFSVSAPYTPERIVKLLYSNGDQEIWVVQPSPSTDHVYPQQKGIFCINLTTKTLQWYLGTTELLNTRSLWDVLSTWPYYRIESLIIHRFGTDAVLFRARQYNGNGYNAYYYYSYFLVPISELTAGTSNAEAVSAITAAGLRKFTWSSTDVNVDDMWDCNYNNGIVADSNYEYILGFYDSSKQGMALQAINKSTKDVLLPLNHRTYPYPLSPGTAKRQVMVTVPQTYLSAGLNKTSLNTDDSDGYFSIFSSTNRYTTTQYVGTFAFTLITNNGITLVQHVVGGKTSSAMYLPPDPMPLNDDPNARLVCYPYGTQIAVEGASHESGAAGRFGGFGQRITVPFTASIGMACPASRRYLVFSAISGGEISWAEADGRCGQYRKYYAYRSTDITDTYEVTGLDVSGGYNTINFQGRAITGVTGVGRMALLDMEAADDEGYDEVSGGSFSNVVYEYLTYNYIPYPFAREGIRAELSNISKTTKITLPETQDNLIRGMLAAGTDFRGSRCILRRVFPDHMDEAGSDIVLLDGYIQDWSYVPGKKGIAFSVSKTLIDVGGQFPKRLMNMGCSHVFKGARCQYLGETGRCLKTKTFCTSLANQLQFGGFPWIAARQRRVMWK